MGKVSNAIHADLLEQAWEHVRTRGTAPGVDGQDLADFEADHAGLLAQLATDMQRGVYAPQAARAVYLPKRSGGTRRVVVATVRDRVAQTAAVLRLHPLLEPHLHPSCFAYRLGMGVADAIKQLTAYRDQGFRTVLCADVENFFDSLDHGILFERLAEIGVEPPWLEWLRQWLTAPCLDNGQLLTPACGAAQGLPVSPLLANLYLTPCDRALDDAGLHGIRYADDITIACANDSEADEALEELRAALASVRLALAESKTRIASFDEGFEVLGVRCEGDAVIPAEPHPYEDEFTPPKAVKPRRPPKQTLPMTLLRTLYLQEQGSTLACHANRLVVTKSKKTMLELPVRHVDQVFVFGRVHITTAALTACLRNGTPVYFLSSTGRYYGVLQEPAGAGHEIRQAQFALSGDAKQRLAYSRAIVGGKLANCLRLLEQFDRNHPGQVDKAHTAALREAMKKAPHAKSLEMLRGIEGNAARHYWAAFGACVRGPLAFPGRRRRPPTDPINSLLSFGYSILYYNIYSYLLARQLDPFVGLFHEPGHNHAALASDMLEEFRAPIIDALVLAMVNTGQVTAGEFYFREGEPAPCFMKDDMRKRYLPALEDKLATLLHHPDVTHEVDWRRAIDLQVCRLRRFVEGKISEYTPFMPK